MLNTTKTIKLITIICLAYAALFTMSSCERNKCKTRGIECLNDGVCFDGECNCPAGWTGKLCDTAASFKFQGRFGGIRVMDNGYATDDTITVVSNGNVNITINPSSTFPYSARVQNNQYFIEDVKLSNNYVYNGNGALNKDRITLTIKVDSVSNGVLLKSFRYAFSGDRVP
jgi:hypothetical protein